MAIVVKDFNWRQSENRIVIRVPLKGIPSNQVDVCIMDIYLKVNFSPFLFEVFLAHAIRENDSRCTLSNEEAVFDLAKDETGQKWQTLHLELSRTEAKELRQQVQERMSLRVQEQAKKQAELKHELKRTAVNQQIKLETDEHKMVDELRNSERNKAMKELQEWKSSREITHPAIKAAGDIFENANATQTKNRSDSNIKGIDKSGCHSQHPDDTSEDSSSESSDSEIWPDKAYGDSITEQDLRPVPLPRGTLKLQVSFTPRFFPTPSRESKQPEEDEWLQKQAEARRQSGFVAEDLRPEECNPDWLKDKGDSFFKAGNYLGAVSAYSHGIKLNPKLAHLYVARASANLAMGNLHRAVEDSSTGLELMVPAVQQNRVDRAKCLTTRGAALCRLGMARQGLDEYKAALKLDPDNEDLKADIARVESVLNDDNDSDLDTA